MQLPVTKHGGTCVYHINTMSTSLPVALDEDLLLVHEIGKKAQDALCCFC